jgi:hypothetical protein
MVGELKPISMFMRASQMSLLGVSDPSHNNDYFDEENKKLKLNYASSNQYQHSSMNSASSSIHRSLSVSDSDPILSTFKNKNMTTTGNYVGKLSTLSLNQIVGSSSNKSANHNRSNDGHNKLSKTAKAITISKKLENFSHSNTRSTMKGRRIGSRTQITAWGERGQPLKEGGSSSLSLKFELMKSMSSMQHHTNMVRRE